MTVLGVEALDRFMRRLEPVDVCQDPPKHSKRRFFPGWTVHTNEYSEADEMMSRARGGVFFRVSFPPSCSVEPINICTLLASQEDRRRRRRTRRTTSLSAW